MSLFDDHNDVLLMYYNIRSPICILLNLLGVYLIVFKSSREMGEYRWHLLHYQIWASAFDIFWNCLFQPVMFFPLIAGTGHGILITKLGLSTDTCLRISFSLVCGLLLSIVELFFYRHQCIIKKQYKLSDKKLILGILLLFLIAIGSQCISISLCYAHPSQWTEQLKKESPEAIEILKIENIYYIPHSKMLELNFVVALLITSFSVLTISVLICHMQYILHKQCKHLTINTQILQKKFLRTQIFQVSIPFACIFTPFILALIRILYGRLGLQIFNDILMMMISTYGIIATSFLISFNNPYWKFLFEKVKGCGKLTNRTHTLKFNSQNLESTK